MKLNLCHTELHLLQALQQRFWESVPQAVAETDQPIGELLEGIDTSPSSTAKPQVLCTYDQHAMDYVRIMMEAGMNLPMGEDRAAPLITEV